jgi:hypothetical protein
MNEFQNAKQADNETIIAFFDRVYYLALQAYPKFQERDDIDELMVSLVQGRFVQGLRSQTIRNELLFHPVDDLTALKDRAHKLEQCEKVGTTQGVIGPAIMRPAGMANANFRFRPFGNFRGQSRGRVLRVGVHLVGRIACH